MRFLLAVVLGGAAVAALYFLGPRATLAPVLRQALPTDTLQHQALEAYLRTAEAEHLGLTPGTEKRIVWADSVTKSRTPWAVVALHGFSASRQETAPVAERVAAALGANLFETRLTGHGLGSDALGAALANDWLLDTQEAVAVGQALGERVLLMGTSTGGTLATWWAATQGADRLGALVLHSPNFGLRDPNAALLVGPWGRRIAQVVTGGWREWQPHNEAHGHFWTTRYPVDALVEMMTLVQAVNDADLTHLRVPTLVLYHPDDEILSIPAMLATFERLGASPKAMQAVPDVADPSRHVLAGDILSPGTTAAVTDRIVAFVHPL